MLQPLLQAQGGNQQDLPAAGVPVLLPLGDEGHGGHIAGQLGGEDGEGETRVVFPAVFHIAEHLDSAALAGQLLHVDLRDQKAAVKPPLRQQRAVFRDHLVGAEHHVGGGFPLAGAGIDIAAQELCRLHGHQLAAVGVLSDEVVAGRQVADNGGSRLGHADGGRVRCPQVLADLKTQLQVRQILAFKDLFRAKGYQFLAAEGDVIILCRRRSKLALLVKFTVIGQMGLGHQAQDLSLLYNRRAVIQFVVYPHRHAHGGDHLQIPGGLQHRGERLLRPPQQGLLIEQVAAGVARQAQLRQHQHLDPRLFRLAHHGKGLLGVVVAVRQAQLGRAAGHRDKTVFHGIDLLTMIFLWAYLTPPGEKMQDSKRTAGGGPFAVCVLGGRKRIGFGRTRCLMIKIPQNFCGIMSFL